MRELTTTEIQLVSGGSFTIEAEEAIFAGAVGKAAHQITQGARLGAIFGPKGALGGAILGGLTWGLTSAYSSFRQS